jgi:hypothetical protein
MCAIARSGEPIDVFLGTIMRIALLTTALIVSMAAWADEPSSPEAKTEAAAEATADKAAAQPTSTETATPTETTAKAIEEDKPFKPPQGYRPKRVNGAQVYCTKIVVLGSRFPKEDCRTESELRQMELAKASGRAEMDQIKHVCTSAAGCANP